MIVIWFTLHCLHPSISRIRHQHDESGYVRRGLPSGDAGADLGNVYNILYDGVWRETYSNQFGRRHNMQMTGARIIISRLPVSHANREKTNFTPVRLRAVRDFKVRRTDGDE